VATESTTDFTLDTAAELAAEEQGVIEGKSPWLLAWRRLRRNYLALSFLLLFVVIVVVCALAPVYSDQVARTGPNEGHLGETFTRDGKQIQIVSKGGFVNGQFVAGGVPVGPQLWHAGGRYVFGADNQGRDVAVRLLYGGINSLKVGIGSALICTLLAVLFALLAGYYGGWVDWIISRFFDLIWAFPVLLLAIALGTALSINGFHHFGINLEAGSLWIPTLVISYVLIPYIGRPLRGQILSLREKEFIEAATAQGASPFRVMFTELTPNIASSATVRTGS
jgi:peptide/nickel transport system permease protein